MFIDSHCHLERLDLTAYQGQLDAALATAKVDQISHILCVATSLGNCDQVVELAERYSQVLAAVGVHPLDISEQQPDISALRVYTQHPKVVAVGETGLDFHYAPETREAQLKSFEQHLLLAQSVALPVIVHTRQAQDETLALLRQHPLSNAGVLHCYTESWEMAKAALDLGFYISISGIVTFRNADAVREMVKKIPLDRLLIETDAPYLTPVPHRGKPNEPRFVREVGRFIADLRQVDEMQFAQQTYDNFFCLFPKARM